MQRIFITICALLLLLHSGSAQQGIYNPYTGPQFGSTLSLLNYLTGSQITAATTSTATNSTTAAGNATLHFAATPGWTVNGALILDLTSPTVIPQGTTVLSSTGTTVVMSANATGGGVGSGDLIMILPDMTAGMTAWIAAVPTLGAQLNVPPGYFYTATCNFALANPVFILGSGQASQDGSQNISNILCGAGASSLFLPTSKDFSVERMTLTDAATLRTAGSAVVYNGAYVDGHAHVILSTIFGFFDSIDIVTGSGSFIDHNQIYNSVNRGVHLRNTLNGDDGGAIVSHNKIFPLANALNGVEINSGGGAVIEANSIEPLGGGNLVDGIKVDFTGIVTQQIKILNNDVDHVTGFPLNVVHGLLATQIIGNYLGAGAGGGNACMSLNFLSFSTVTGNTCKGSGAAAISVTQTNNTWFGVNDIGGFTLPISYGASSGTPAFTDFALMDQWILYGGNLWFGSTGATGIYWNWGATGGLGNKPIIVAQLGDTSDFATIQGKAIWTCGVSNTLGKDAAHCAEYISQTNGVQLALGNNGNNFGALCNFNNDIWRLGETVSGSSCINPALEYRASGTTNVSGTVRTYKDFRVSKTGNYSIAADGSTSDSGTEFDTCGAAGEVDFTLPTAVVGLKYGFTVCAAQTLKIIAGASTSIAIGPTNSAAAGNVTANTTFNSIQLEAISTTQWYAKSVTGLWTVN